MGSSPQKSGAQAKSGNHTREKFHVNLQKTCGDYFDNMSNPFACIMRKQ